MDFPVKKVSFRTLLIFFIPLGFSASLVNVSHVIINSTLARAPDPAVVIASYAVARSLFDILERCAVILRQTSSALVRDKLSFKAMSVVTVYVLGAILIVGLAISYLPLGKWIFSIVMGVKDTLLASTMNTYRILLFVTIFSGIRCLFQGVIISNLRTKWMTIGMMVRLVFLISAAWIALSFGWVNHGYVGAILFLFGMMIETFISVWVGRTLVKEMPEKRESHSIAKQSQVLQFYRPFLFASLLAVSIMPSINIALGWTPKPEIAIAAFAVAFSVTQLFISFTTYVHQIVINFYGLDPKAVIKFTLMLSMLPALLLAGITFTPVGTWGLYHIIGVSGELLDGSLTALRVFIIFAFCFPLLNYVNGILMLKRQMKIMKVSKMGNVLLTIITLFIGVFFFSSAGAVIGALSQSVGILVECTIVLLFLGLVRDENKPKRRQKSLSQPQYY